MECWPRWIVIRGGCYGKKNLAQGKTRLNDVNMQPLIVGNKIYVATYAGDLYCLNKRDGSIIWQVAIGSAVRFSIASDKLYVSGSDGVVYALRADDGEQLWQYRTVKGALSQPLIYHELLAVGSTEESLIFIDGLTGRLIAHRFARKNISGDPILAGSEGDILVTLSNAGRVYALKLKKNFRMHGKATSRGLTPIHSPDHPEAPHH